MLEQAFSAATAALAARGWHCGSDLVAPALSTALAAEASELWARGAFRPAAVGRGADRRVAADVRGDWLLWLDPTRLTPPQQAFWDLMERFRRHLNRELFLSLHELELQYAAYPAGTAYRRHLDQFQQVQARLITVLLYLNRDWTSADGGGLRLFPSPDSTAPAAEIPPVLGTFLCFRSDMIPHEVLPPWRLRLTLGGWLRLRPEIPLAGATPRPT